jgi:Protein of unknown function (DUF3631)
VNMPPAKVCVRIRKLHGMLGATAKEAETAREMLFKLLTEHGLTWNDLTPILVAGEDNDSSLVPGDERPQEATSAPEVNPLDLLLALIERHIAITADERLAVALWILHTYVYDRFQNTPRLALLSPVNGCGKTTLLSFLMLLVRYGCSTANTTPAVIYYELERNPLTTWLIDEGDNLDLNRQSNGVVRSVLNMGHTRGATVCRMVKGEPLKIRVFAPLAIAAIGALPFPLLRRSITVNMQRPGREQKLDRLDDTSPQWAASREQIQRWANTCKLAPDPALPSPLRNRAADNWRALVAIADDLGHGEAARAAAISLSSNRIYTEPGVALLADILTVFEQAFEQAQADRLASAALLAGLLGLNDGDWNEWKGPKEDQPPRKLTLSGLAAMLRPFHIRPRTIWPKQRRPDDSSSRGYLRSDFQRAWDAYCRADTPTQPSEVIPLDDGRAAA